MRALVFTFMIFLAQVCVAENDAQRARFPDIDLDEPKMRQKSQISLDAAESSARGGHTLKIPQVRTPSKGVDVNQIAERYKQVHKSGEKQDDGLLIFVSLSMPEKALINLAKQAKETKAVLVMRGVSGGLGSWAEGIKALEPISAQGAALMIHPDFFKKYKVQQVPSFVLRTNGETDDCSDDTECKEYLQSYGDVSLDYVLERWAQGKGYLAKEAKKRLDMMSDVL